MKLDLNNLVGKTIQFTKKVEEGESDFDTDMKGVVTDVRLEEYPDGENVVKLEVDFSKFEEHNKGKAKADYWAVFANDPELSKFGHDETHLVKWHETCFYPENKIATHYYMEKDPDFVVLENFGEGDGI